MEPDDRPRDRPGLHARPRLRRQPRRARALEQRPAERHRPELPLARRQAERRVPAGHDVAQRRAAAVRGLGRADDELRADGGAGPPALPAVLLDAAGPQRAPRHLRLPLAAGQAREALLARHVLPRVLHAGRACTRAAPTTPSGTRSRGTARAVHLAVRAEPQPGAGDRRRDPPPLGRPRLGRPGGQGQEVDGHGRARPTRFSAAGSSRRSSATRPASRSSSVRATATSPASSGPPASRRSSGDIFAQDFGNLDVGEARSSTRAPSSRRTRSTTTTGTARGSASTASPATATRTSRSSRTRRSSAT